MILRRARSFLALDSLERGLALRAIVWLAFLRVMLRVEDFAALRRRTERAVKPGPPATPAQVRRALQRAIRTLPDSSCLAQSLVAQRLLRSAGLDAVLTIGVASGNRTERVPLDAHAWVVSGGVMVVGDAQPLDPYQELVTFGSHG